MRFTFLRNKHGHPVATLATSLIHAGQGNIRADMVAWALATCNPLDQFRRDLGRAIAAGRIFTQMPQRLVLVDTSLHVKARILNIIANDHTLPQRTREAARIMLSKKQPGPFTVDGQRVPNKKRGPNQTDATPWDNMGGLRAPVQTPAPTHYETNRLLAAAQVDLEDDVQPEPFHNPSGLIQIEGTTTVSDNVKANMAARSALFKAAKAAVPVDTLGVLGPVTRTHEEPQSTLGPLEGLNPPGPRGHH